MGYLSAVREYDKAEETTETPPLVAPSVARNSSQTVNKDEYLSGFSDKDMSLRAPKKEGFVSGFITGVDEGEEATTAGKVGSVLGYILREPAKKATLAGAELWSDDVKGGREALDKIRKTNPELAARLEYGMGGGRLTTAQAVTQLSAGLAETLVTVLTLGLGSAALRGTILAKEAYLLSKFGRVGKYAEAGLREGATIGQRVSALGATGGAYGGLYGFLAGLEEGGDWERAIKNVPTYAVGGALAGAALPAAISGLGAGARAVGAGVKFASEFVPDSANPVTLFKRGYNKLPYAIQNAVSTEAHILRTKFGETGAMVRAGLERAREVANRDIGIFQDDLVRLGGIDAPQFAKKAFDDAARANRTFYKDNRAFKIALTDALEQEGIFRDPKVLRETLERDPYFKEVFEFIRAKQREIWSRTPREIEQVDPDRYAPKYTPFVELSGRRRNAALNAKTYDEQVAAYAGHSSVADDMIEHAVARGNFKTKADAYRTYYDASDIINGVNAVPAKDNAYLKWLVANGHAGSIESALKKVNLRVAHEGEGTLTPRAQSLDYERSVPYPWRDPDALRSLGHYYVKGKQRIAYAEEFGADDEKLVDAAEAILNSQGGEMQANFEKLIRNATGMVLHSNDSRRWSAIIRSIEMMHIVFSQMINPVTLLNYAATADTKHLFAGFAKAYSQKGMREAVERGVFVSDMIRQLDPYQKMGDRAIFNILKMSGFTYTENLNRAVGVHVAEAWAKYNVQRLMKGATKVEGAAVDPLTLEARKYKSAEEFVKAQGGWVAKEAKAYDSIDDFKNDWGFLFGEGSKNSAPLSFRVSDNVGLRTRESVAKEYKINPDQVYQVDVPTTHLKPKYEGTINPDQMTSMENAPAVEIVLENGKLRVADGNHRTAQAIESGYDAVPAWVIDKDGVMGKLQGEYIADYFDASKSLPTPSQLTDIWKKAQKTGGAFTDTQSAAHLRDLGLDPETILKNGGKLTNKDLITAAQRMVEFTQGDQNPLTMPGLANSPWGKVFYQFKRFGYMQTNFFYKQFVRDFRSKDTRSFGRALKFAMVMGAAYPMTYGALKDLRDLVTLNKDPDELFDLKEYFTSMGAFASAGGLLVDFLNRVGQGKNRAIEFAVGPAAGDVASYLDAIATLPKDVEDGMEKLRKQLLRNTGIGRVLNNVLDN